MQYYLLIKWRICGYGNEYLTQSGVTENLPNASVCQKLSKGLAYTNLQGVERLIESFINRHRNVLSAEV